MKRIISAILILATVAVFTTGCGAKGKDRALYNVKLSKYIDLGDYKDLPVDTSSDTFKEFRNEVISIDVSSNELYVKKTEGTVANGDTVNIDYTGKKDGVAFEGGTATGSDLEIGSNSFIDGFESGLIGATIGSTVDLNLTFPEEYQSADLAGAAVVFTVKVNYVKTTEERKPEDYYKELNFSTVEKYYEDVDERAVKNYLLDAIKANSKIKNYPEEDIETLYSSTKSMMEKNIQSQYGMDFAGYLSAISQTEADFKKEIVKDQIKPTMDSQLVLYAILDKEKLTVSEKDINAQVNEIVKSIGNVSVTADTVKDFYGDYYFEYNAVSDKVLDFVYDNAKIKK